MESDLALLDATFIEEQDALRTLQKAESTREIDEKTGNPVNDVNAIDFVSPSNNDASIIYENETNIAEDPTNRRDEERLEGAAIGDSENIVYSSDEEEDDDVKIFVTKPTGPKIGRISTFKMTERGQRSYVRPQLKDPSKQDSEEQERLKLKEEIKALRFTHHRTSFDVDIEALEQHPWRKSFANLSDYFNYGFDEDSWRIYCEKQLRLRASKGLGPFNPSALALASSNAPPQAGSISQKPVQEATISKLPAHADTGRTLAPAYPQAAPVPPTRPFPPLPPYGNLPPPQPPMPPFSMQQGSFISAQFASMPYPPSFDHPMNPYDSGSKHNAKFDNALNSRDRESKPPANTNQSYEKRDQPSSSREPTRSSRTRSDSRNRDIKSKDNEKSREGRDRRHDSRDRDRNRDRDGKRKYDRSRSRDRDYDREEKRRR